MLGETRGKRIVRRVLSSDPMKVEVTNEDSGKLCGVDVDGFGTYSAVIRPDGSLYGEGQGAYVTGAGEMATWIGSGVGKFVEGGGVSYRGILYFRTTSQKLARLNNAGGVFEYDVDSKGAARLKLWEWK